MSAFSLSRRLVAEALGTGFLVATVVGSGIMADRLAGGNAALALLCNTIPTGAILVVLILALGPVSGAHLNPAVSLVMAVNRALPWREAGLYAAAQVAGGCLGTLLAHAMFGLELLQAGGTARSGAPLWLAEFVATFGLLATILALVRFRLDAVPVAVGLYITAAYWFTASTSFANPAVTVARGLTDTFAGIAPGNVPMFVLAQLAGALSAAALLGWLLGSPQAAPAEAVRARA
ncbi:MAG TPA: MIP/aquaporin family protein [Beijerinckiaceae bacterium]|nr:MIP/aquaporin family protein [Beijerinckiaceae bacterium]